MPRRAAARIQRFAVVRFESQLDDPNLAVTVKEVLPTIQEADAEVARLNDLAKRRNWESIMYFRQATKVYPSGRRVEVKY